MINLVHKQNGEIYDKVASGELTLKKARDEFLAMARQLIRNKVEPKLVGVLDEIGKAWASLIEQEYIDAQRTRFKNVIKNRTNIDMTSPESCFLYK